MRVEPDYPRRLGEQRRYFPDWTLRLLESRPELEADHNSYLAGGYSEEFGYRAQAGYSRGMPVLEGEIAEQTTQWCGQAAGIHPGYPIRPHPIAVDSEQTSFFETSVTSDRSRAFGARTVEGTDDCERHGAFVVVTNRSYERDRKRASQRAAAVMRRSVATLIAWRWSFVSRRARPTLTNQGRLTRALEREARCRDAAGRLDGSDTVT